MKNLLSKIYTCILTFFTKVLIQNKKVYWFKTKKSIFSAIDCKLGLKVFNFKASFSFLYIYICILLKEYHSILSIAAHFLKEDIKVTSNIKV